MSLAGRQGILAHRRDAPQVDPDDPDAIFKPVSYASLAAARTALNAPSDANYVMWNHDGQSLEQVFASLGANDILVLPERAQPYPIDSSNGFMASGVSQITGPNGTRTPIVSNSRLWFSMCRARRGVIGLGPGAVIEPTNSGWTGPPQPRPPLYWYNTSGEQMSELLGAQNKLMEADHLQAFFANFTLKGRDFGGIAYSGLSTPPNGTVTIKRIHFNQSWRGFESVPNGETGGLGFLRSHYTIENCLFNPHPTYGPSPIMWNRTTGGVMRNVKVTKHEIGMITFWRCLGVNTFENVHTDAPKVAVNLEEEEAGFELNWTGGAMYIESNLNGFHLNINPAGGSQKIHLSNVDVSLNGWTPGALTAQVYTTANTQKRSDVTWDGGTVSYVPSSRWID
jgi:hypothetical protein